MNLLKRDMFNTGCNPTKEHRRQISLKKKVYFHFNCHQGVATDPMLYNAYPLSQPQTTPSTVCPVEDKVERQCFSSKIMFGSHYGMHLQVLEG